MISNLTLFCVCSSTRLINQSFCFRKTGATKDEVNDALMALTAQKHPILEAFQDGYVHACVPAIAEFITYKTFSCFLSYALTDWLPKPEDLINKMVVVHRGFHVNAPQDDPATSLQSVFEIERQRLKTCRYEQFLRVIPFIFTVSFSQ
jgi:hypothetical protein